MTSLRKIAKELGGSHTLLVLYRQGKRSLKPELERMYHQLVSESGYPESGYTGDVSNSRISDRFGESSRAAPTIPAARAGSSAWLEHRTFNPSVQGSNPCRPTSFQARKRPVRHACGASVLMICPHFAPTGGTLKRCVNENGGVAYL